METIEIVREELKIKKISDINSLRRLIDICKYILEERSNKSLAKVVVRELIQAGRLVEPSSLHWQIEDNWVLEQAEKELSFK